MSSHEKLKHYYDTGEFAVTRGLKQYKALAFPDENFSELKLWLSQKPEAMKPENPMEWSMRYYHSLKRFLPQKTDDKIVCLRDKNIEYTWDWKEKNLFGGFDNFFTKGSSMLDLGSGKGRAVKEINEKFAGKDIKCVGVDYRYSKEKIENPENLIAGDFEELPFKNNFYDRILSVESFPCWLPFKEKTIDKYIEEITRVSKIGSIWRGTLPIYEMGEEIKFPTEKIIEKFVKNGWEVVVIGGKSFTAKLIYKD